MNRLTRRWAIQCRAYATNSSSESASYSTWQDPLAESHEQAVTSHSVRQGAKLVDKHRSTFIHRYVLTSPKAARAVIEAWGLYDRKEPFTVVEPFAGVCLVIDSFALFLCRSSFVVPNRLRSNDKRAPQNPKSEEAHCD